MKQVADSTAGIKKFSNVQSIQSLTAPDISGIVHFRVQHSLPPLVKIYIPLIIIQCDVSGM